MVFPHSGDAGRLFGVVVLSIGALGAWGGAVWGFIRGFDYLPTLPFAVIEGAVLFGVPSCVLGVLVGGLAVIVRSLSAGAR